MKEKDFGYFTDKNAAHEKRKNEIKAEIDKLIKEINELDSQLEQCLDKGNMEKYKEISKKKSEIKDDIEVRTLYYEKVSNVNHKSYEAEEVKEAWEKICVEFNKNMKSEFESLVKIREKYIEAVEKFTKINSENRAVGRKWGKLLTPVDRRAILGNRCDDGYNDVMPGLTNYDEYDQSVMVSYGEVMNK